jgi:hypothetical protein
MSAPAVNHINELSGLPRMRQAWGRQDTLPPLTTRARVPTPRMQQRRRNPSAVPTIDTLLSPPPTPRVKLLAPKIKRPVKPAYEPPNTESLFESLEQDAEVADLQRRVENFKQKNLSRDAESLMLEAMYVQHQTTKNKYTLRHIEVKLENQALKQENLALKQQNLELKQMFEDMWESAEHDFKCPISHEVFKDPVVASDGHTYERASITQWWKHKKTSPITNASMADKMLIPNHSLKSMIESRKPRK